MFGFVTPTCIYIEMNMAEHNAMSCNVATSANNPSQNIIQGQK